MMNGSHYVPTGTARDAVCGREAEIIRALGVPWNGRGDHIPCPDPAHDDRNPSWRLMPDGRAVCSCRRPHSVFDVISYVRGLDFEAAKIVAVELIGRPDLIIDPEATTGSGLTLAQYAEAKRLPVEVLREQGLRDARYAGRPAVAIPFRDVTGQEVGIHFRLALAGHKDMRFRWGKGSKPCAYGAWQAAHFATAGYAVIVEGESDCHTLWHNGFPSLGLPGAALWNEDRDAPLLADVPIVYVVVEPDLGGAQTLNWLARSSIASRTRLVQLSPETKDPSALYLADQVGFRDAFQMALDAAEPFAAAPTAGGEQQGASNGISLDDFYAYMPTHNYIYVPARAMWPASSVNARIPPIPVGPDKAIQASTWLDQNRPVEQMTWAPGLPELIDGQLVVDGGWIHHRGARCYNQYMPPRVEAGDPAKAQPWIEHIRLVYPDEADHILDWLAHRVQRPQEKINHALVLGGQQGIGKDTLLEPVKYAIGGWNFQEVSPSQVMGRFNGFLKAVILRISEARDLGDSDRFKFYDHMKAYTASPPDTLRIDEKNLRQYSIFNCCGVIITTNHKTDGIFLSPDDRRHFVAWSDRTKEDVAFQGGYWTRLYGWYHDGGMRHVAAYLMQRDIRSFDPKAPPPKTTAFWAICDANRAPEESELADVLDQLGNPRAITLNRIQNMADGEFAEWLKDRRNRRAIPHRLEQCGYVPVRNPDDRNDGQWRVAGKRQTVYAVRTLSLRDQITAAREMQRW